MGIILALDSIQLFTIHTIMYHVLPSNMMNMKNCNLYVIVSLNKYKYLFYLFFTSFTKLHESFILVLVV